MNKFTIVFFLASLLFCLVANVNANVDVKECNCVDSDNEGTLEAILGTDNEKRMNLEKKSLINEPAAAEVNANGADSDDGCYTNTNGYTTTVFVTSTTETRTVTTTSEKIVSTELPTFTTTTSTTVAYRPTNDITNGSTHASNISKLTFIVLAFVALLFI